MKVRCGIVSSCLLYVASFTSQTLPSPTAKFHFNNGSDHEAVSKRKIKMHGVSFAPDRFGNGNSAVYLYGNAASYVNLGNYPAIKPLVGTISMWVNLQSEVWSGKGREMNSFIITKNSKGDDFYEAYNISYFLDSKKVAAVSAQDSLDQLSIFSISKFDLFKWHHLAITYDDSTFAFYVDGEVKKKLPKKFKTRFEAGDSVLVGVTGNKKNHRFSHGYFDDIAFYDKVLTDKEVYELYKAPNPNRNQAVLKVILATVAGIFALFLILLYIRFRIRLKLKKEKQQLEQVNKSLENELRVHRALMNPHFIFNSLNGLQDFILRNANDEANDYLIRFSQLLRKILESNMSDSISLEMEIDLLKNYIEIEGMRFEENIAYSVTVSPDLPRLVTQIPIMMLQPFVENAIWHGLLNKKGDKTIGISFSLYLEKYVLCTIEDNGIGRKKSEADESAKKSMAIIFIRQRLELLNKIHKLNCSLEIVDKPNGSGTVIRIILPILSI